MPEPLLPTGRDYADGRTPGRKAAKPGLPRRLPPKTPPRSTRQGDCEGDGHRARRQGKHQRIAITEGTERGGKLPAGIVAIME